MHVGLAVARVAARDLCRRALHQEEVAEESEHELEEHVLIARAIRRILVRERGLEEEDEHRDDVLLEEVQNVAPQVGLVRGAQLGVELISERHRHRDEQLDHGELETLLTHRRGAHREREQSHRQHPQLREAQVERPLRRVPTQVPLNVPHALEAVLPFLEVRDRRLCVQRRAFTR